jgi:hypothetical protein
LAEDVAGDADHGGIRRRLEFIDCPQGECALDFCGVVRCRQPVLVDRVDTENSQRIDIADPRRPFALLGSADCACRGSDTARSLSDRRKKLAARSCR